MWLRNRRRFLQDVGRGMLVASVGATVASDLGLSPAWAGEEVATLDFGAREQLAALMQETPPAALQTKLVQLLNSGTSLHDLVAAAALANARSFGGEDYIGFHTLMALGPAYSMAALLPKSQQALPVLKVLYRNASQIQATGGRAKEALHPVSPAELASGTTPADQLHQAVRAKDRERAEGILAAITMASPRDGHDALLSVVEDQTEVHRVVLAHRAWDMLQIVGMEHAETMLRQSLRFCVKGADVADRHGSAVRALLPRLMESYSLMDREPGTTAADDAWLHAFSQTLFESTPEQAAEATAAAMAEGINREHIGEAIALAANQLVLRDRGRVGNHIQPGKPEGSVHGDSVGVHASDSAHAWRGIARVANRRNAAAALILAGYQVANDRVNSRGDFANWAPRPNSEQLERIAQQDADTLLHELDAAVRINDQNHACAVTHRYGELGFNERPLMDVLLKYAVSEDGALHAEKYYRTTCDEFAATRLAFRWRQMVALARVTASEHGNPAPGVAEARELLGIV